MKVLVTGATAQPARALIAAVLRDPGVEVVLASAVDERVRLPSHPRLVFHRADLTRSRAVHDLMHGPVRALGIDAVVHGALHRSACDEGPAVHDQNVEITRGLVTAAAAHPSVRRFVFRSSGAVYAVCSREPNLLDEDAALELGPAIPQWVRDRVEADLTVCAHLGDPDLQVMVLRCAEILAPEAGSQLWDYLQSRVRLRPMGFDPMLDLLSLDDAVAAMRLALAHHGHGVFKCRDRCWRRSTAGEPGRSASTSATTSTCAASTSAACSTDGAPRPCWGTGQTIEGCERRASHASCVSPGWLGIGGVALSG